MMTRSRLRGMSTLTDEQLRRVFTPVKNGAIHCGKNTAVISPKAISDAKLQTVRNDTGKSLKKR